MIQAEVYYYVPVPDDLNYPEKLHGYESQGLALWTEDERLRDSEIGGFKLPREEAQVTWYPTLKRTVWVLSKLNTYVKVRRSPFLLLRPFPLALPAYKLTPWCVEKPERHL